MSPVQKRLCRAGALPRLNQESMRSDNRLYGPTAVRRFFTPDSELRYRSAACSPRMQRSQQDPGDTAKLCLVGAPVPTSSVELAQDFLDRRFPNNPAVLRILARSFAFPLRSTFLNYVPRGQTSSVSPGERDAKPTRRGAAVDPGTRFVSSTPAHQVPSLSGSRPSARENPSRSPCGE